MAMKTLILLAICGGSACFQPANCGRRCSSSRTFLRALTPVGPFCPFRSDEANEIEAPMGDLEEDGSSFAVAFARLNLDLQMGNTPDKEQLLETSKGLKQAVEKWEQMTTRMKESNDFQTREYSKLTEAHLESYGENVQNLVAGLRWQADCLKAMANGQMPPMPPPGVDIQKMMEAAQNQAASPSIPQMSAAERITSTPFSGEEPAFQSPLVKEEFEALCRDHSRLIEFGGGYGQFDPLGKLFYLDEMEKIEERWDVFFARFSLMNAIDSRYTEQCSDFLEAMNMDEVKYRELLKECHRLMREEAEAERNLI